MVLSRVVRHSCFDPLKHTQNKVHDLMKELLGPRG